MYTIYINFLKDILGVYDEKLCADRNYLLIGVLDQKRVQTTVPNESV